MKGEIYRKICQEVMECRACSLWRTRTQPICGEGNLDARLMVVAQAPGDVEDRDGRMFLGPSGKVLNRLLEGAGVERLEIYMTNLVKCRLPGYRKPKRGEIDACSKFLEREIELVSPKFLIPLGYFATKYVLERYGGIKDIPKDELSGFYGKLLWTGSLKIFPLPHPAYLLYHPEDEKDVYTLYRKLGVFKDRCKWRFL